MRIALVTTTINVPHVLKLYRQLGPDVVFFVALDKKTPEEAVNFLMYDMDKNGDTWRTNALFIQDQQKWKCSEPIGWNTIQRRNIATLEALKWGAELIVSIDDDNIPIDHDYFSFLDRLFDSRPWNGCKVSGFANWFDYGQLLIPPTPQRGTPINIPALYRVDPIIGARVGVVAGAVLGDTDMDAYTRIARQQAPQDVHGVSELLRSVHVSDDNTFAVFNSQNTAFLRELAPAMFMIPYVGRYDDIFASIITKRVMKDRDLYLHFGQPFVWQQRNPHKHIYDLKDEILGMEHVDEFARFVDRFPRSSNPLIPFLEDLFGELLNFDWWPVKASNAAFAWLEDCKRVMG